MDALRRLILRRRTVAGIMLAAALAMRLLVPAGFMPDSAAGNLRLILCPAASPIDALTAAGPAKHVMTRQDHREHGHQSAPQDAPCAFGGLALASLLPVDPVLLAAAILFAMVLAAFGRIAPTPPIALFLRPPLRGPPARV
ncbi:MULTISPECIES: hypothetical protein [Sphingomonas]|uniref:hypothetical protein n=1 Tax=Sphingomonas TaxID=13687 RepID=UPI0025877225|nr:hypothetical protein [Sphingomonas sp.]